MMAHLCRVMILVFIANTIAPELLWAQRASLDQTTLQQKVQQTVDQAADSYDSIDGTTPEGFFALINLVNKMHEEATQKNQANGGVSAAQENNLSQRPSQVQDGQLYATSRQQQNQGAFSRSGAAAVFLRDVEDGKYEDPAQLIDAMDEWGNYPQPNALKSAYAAEILLNGSVQAALENPEQLDRDLVSFILPRLQVRALHSLTRLKQRNAEGEKDEGIVAALGTLRVLLLQTHKLYQVLGMDDPLTTQVTEMQNTYTGCFVYPTRDTYQKEKVRLQQQATSRSEGLGGIIMPSYEDYCKTRTTPFVGQEVPAGYEKGPKTLSDSSQSTEQNEQIFSQFMQDFIDETQELLRDGKTKENDEEFAFLNLHIQYVGRYALLYPQGANSLPEIVTLLEHKDTPKNEKKVTDFETKYGAIIEILFATLTETPKILQIPSENATVLKEKLIEFAGPQYTTAVRVSALVSAGLLNQVGVLAGTDENKPISSSNSNPAMAFDAAQRQKLVSYAVDLYAPTVDRPEKVYTNRETIALFGRDVTGATTRPSIYAVWNKYLPKEKSQEYYGLDAKQIPVFQKQVTSAIANLLPVMACDYTLDKKATQGLPMPVYKDPAHKTGCAKLVEESRFPSVLDHRGSPYSSASGSLVSIPVHSEETVQGRQITHDDEIVATISDPLFLLDSQGNPFDVYDGGRPNMHQKVMEQAKAVGRFLLEATLWAFGGEIFIFGIRALQMTRAGVRLLPNAFKAGKTVYASNRAVRTTQAGTKIVNPQFLIEAPTAAKPAGTATGKKIPFLPKAVGEANTSKKISKINSFGTKLRGFGQDVWSGTKTFGQTFMENMWLGGSTTGLGTHIGAAFVTTRAESVWVNGVRETQRVTRLGSGFRNPMAIDFSKEFGSKNFWGRLFARTPETQYITIAQGDQVFNFTRQQLLDMGIRNVNHLSPADKVKIWQTAVKSGLDLNPMGYKYPWLIRPFNFKYWLGLPGESMFGMGGDSGVGAAGATQKTANVRKALRTFGLDENATFGQVKKAYRNLQLNFHPDRINVHEGNKARAFIEEALAKTPADKAELKQTLTDILAQISEEETLGNAIEKVMSRLPKEKADILQRELDIILDQPTKEIVAAYEALTKAIPGLYGAKTTDATTIREALNGDIQAADILALPGKAPKFTTTKTILKNMFNRYVPAVVNNIGFFILWDLWDRNLFPLQTWMLTSTVTKQSEKEQEKYGDQLKPSPYDSPLPDPSEQGSFDVLNPLAQVKDIRHDHEGALLSTPVIGATILFGKDFMKGSQAAQLSIGANNIAFNRAQTKNEERKLITQFEAELKVWEDALEKNKAHADPQLKKMISILNETLAVLKNPDQDTKGLKSFKEEYKNKHQGNTQGYRWAYLQKQLEAYGNAQAPLLAKYHFENVYANYQATYALYQSYLGSPQDAQARKVLQEMDRLRPALKEIFKNEETSEEQKNTLLENVYNDKKFVEARTEFEVAVFGPGLKDLLKVEQEALNQVAKRTGDTVVQKEYLNAADEMGKLGDQVEDILNSKETAQKKLQTLQNIHNKFNLLEKKLDQMLKKKIDLTESYKADLQETNPKILTADAKTQRAWIKGQAENFLEQTADGQHLPGEWRLIEQRMEMLEKIADQKEISADDCVQAWKILRKLDSELETPSVWPPYNETQEAKEQIEKWLNLAGGGLSYLEQAYENVQQGFSSVTQNTLGQYQMRLQQILSHSEEELAKIWTTKASTKEQLSKQQQQSEQLLKELDDALVAWQIAFQEEAVLLDNSSNSGDNADEELYPEANAPIYTGAH